MPITLISAMTKNRVIGKDNSIPWHLPADFAYFKKHTMGKPMLMGHHTFASLPGVLPGRKHFVLSHEPLQSKHTDVMWLKSLDDVSQYIDPSQELMVIGGAHVYSQMIDQADTILLTEIDAEIDGDRYFPSINTQDFEKTSSSHYPKDEHNAYAMNFLRYERIKKHAHGQS